MEHKYHKAALLASAAAVAGLMGLGTPRAEALGWPQMFGQATANQPAIPAPIPVSGSARLADGTYSGPSVDAYYGLVQVSVSIQGGKLVSINVLRSPADQRTSRYINSQALPMLQREVIQAQSAWVSGVSGATLTSQAYIQSVGAALRKAGA